MKLEWLEKRVLLAVEDVALGQMFAGDLDGDGRDELVVVHDRFVRAWTIADGVRSAATQLATLPAGGRIVGVRDFDADGTDDLLVQVDHELYAWPIQNMQVGTPRLITEMGVAQHAMALADLNGDGKAEAILENLSWADTGIEAWPIDVQYPFAEKKSVGVLAWNNHELQVADMDGNGDDDLVFVNRDDGTVGYWRMRATGGAEYVGLGFADLVNWRLLGAANAASGAELIWLHPQSGTVGAWSLVNGVTTYRHVVTVEQGQRFVTAADLDGDGSDALLWQDKRTGAVAAWGRGGGGGEQWLELLPTATRRYNTAAVRNIQVTYLNVGDFYRRGGLITGGVSWNASPFATGDGVVEILVNDEVVFAHVLQAGERQVQFSFTGPTAPGEYTLQARLTVRPYGWFTTTIDKFEVFDEATLDATAADLVVTDVRYKPGTYQVGEWFEIEVDVLNQGGPGRYKGIYWYETYRDTIADLYIGDTRIGSVADSRIPAPGESTTVSGYIAELGSAESAGAGSLRVVVRTTATPERWSNNEWVGAEDLYISNRPKFYAGDFDGDGGADLLVDNTAQGRWEVWMVKNGVYTETRAIDVVPGPTPPRIGDFDGDGTDDLLVQDGDQPLQVWLMTNGQVTQKNQLAPGAYLRGVGDVNGDGTDDLVWSIGQGWTGAWLMKDGVASGWQLIGQADYKAWALLGLADLDADGDDDLIWSSDRSRTKQAWDVGTWQMGAGGPKWVYLGRHEAGTFAGSADFDGNGTGDLFLRGPYGQYSAWLNAPDLGHFVAPTGGLDWRLIGFGDVTNDGKDDVVWIYRGVDIEAWVMNGPNYNRYQPIWEYAA